MSSTTLTPEMASATTDPNALVFSDELNDSEPWKADRPGKELRGTLRELGHFVSSYTGEETMRVTIEDSDGVRWSWIPSTQPKRLISERYLAGVIDIGKPIAIRYVDEVAMKNGSGKLKRFQVLPNLPESTMRARAANAVKACTKTMSDADDTGLKVPDDGFTDDDPSESLKKSVLNTMG